MKATQMRLWMVAAAVAATAGAVAVAPAEGQQAQPLEQGLIVSTPRAAIERGAERIENLALQVSVSERMLYVMSGDEVVRRYPVSVGKGSHPTPTGSFRIDRMIWNPGWVPPQSEWARGRTAKGPGEPGNPMGRIKIFFRAPDYYIHGTGHASSLGEAASHGCIRMRDVDAIELGRLLMMNGGSDRPEAWFQQTIDRRTVSRTVRLSNPVTVRIRA
jgi:lipoprotein-anchoring transpeptidase ErfK/SrfK